MYVRGAMEILSGIGLRRTKQESLDHYYSTILGPYVKKVVRKWVGFCGKDIEFEVLPLGAEVQVTFWRKTEMEESNSQSKPRPLEEGEMEMIKMRILKFSKKRIQNNKPLMVKRCGTNTVRYCWAISLDRRETKR